MMTTLTHADPILPPSRTLARLRALAQRRATWVLMDQAIVSGGNFLTLRYLLVYLTQKQFGNYGVLFETINYLNSLQAAVVIYPLTVRGASGDGRHLKQLATASLIFTLLLLPILGGAMVGSAYSIHDPRMALAAAGALLLWQLQETLRRGLMSDLRFAAAVPGDAISYLGQAAAVFVVGRAGHLNLTTTFLIMAATSAAAAVVQIIQIGLQRVSFVELRALALSFWKLAKWMLPNNAVSLITALGYWYVLRFFYHEEGAAMFAATAFFFKPANPVQSSMSSLVVPAVARANKDHGKAAARRQALRYLMFGAVLLAPYFALLAIAPEWCIRIASHGRSEYAGIGLYIRLFVLNYICVYVSAVLGAWLAGLGQTRFSFYAQIMNVIATLLIGLPLTIKFGVTGLIIGGLISAGSSMLGTIWFLQHPDVTSSPAEAVSEPMPISSPELVTTLPPRPKLLKRNRKV